MKTRVITSVVGIVLLLAVMFFYETIFFNLVIAAVCLIAIHEIYNAFHFGPKSGYIYAGFVPITLMVMLSDYARIRFLLQPVAYLTILYFAICVIVNVNSVNFSKLAGTALFSGCVVYCFYSLIYLKSLLPSEVYGFDAVYFVALILGFAWGGDTMAYFVGRAFGKHKLAPVVSPKKTVEGAIGGIVGSMAIGVLFTVIYVVGFSKALSFARVRFSYYIIIALLGGVASVLGIVGDLFASAIKRQNNIKDFGTIFPGHGGILDRFDSVLFIAPLVTFVVRVVFYHFKG